MRIRVIDAIALAIFKFEGDKPGDRAYRNCNPGNLRATGNGESHDAQGYRTFPLFVAGYRALMLDLECKISGHNVHELGPESTLLDLFRVYAPSDDHNAPANYSRFVADWLRRTYVTSAITNETRLRHIYEIVGEEVPSGVAAA